MKLITQKYLSEAWDKANRILSVLESCSTGKPETMYMVSLKQIKILVEQIWAMSAFCGFCHRIIPCLKQCNCPPSQGARAARRFGNGSRTKVTSGSKKESD